MLPLEFLLGKSLIGFCVRAFLFTLLIVIALVCLWPPRAHAADVAYGDSIACGVGHALHVSTRCRVGAGSCEIARRFKPRGTFAHALISAGINDNGACELAVRSGLHARRVTWVIPAAINGGAYETWMIVRAYGDGFVNYMCPGGHCTKANFHPASYGQLAAMVRRDWRTH